MKNNIKLKTQPYKGTSDAYPEDMLVRNYIFDTWKRVAESFGYEEYDTPLLEEADLYRAKSGDEIANTQLYNFTDKGGREVAIRPEMTPSLARMIANKKNEMTLPLRLFNIGKYYRYEKPQRGRTREFFQLNIDIFGLETIQAELEILRYINAVMKEFKAPKETYEIRINNRYLLDFLFTKMLNLNEEMRQTIGRAIDNYPKMEELDFYAYVKELGLDNMQIESLRDYISLDIDTLKKYEKESKGARQILELFEKAKELGVGNIVFEPTIMRGFQYYTGTVIEMFDIGTKDNPRALLGGGRYDDLLSLFEGDKLPAFGLGWGDKIMVNYLETYNLLPELKTQTSIYIPLLEESLIKETSKIADILRSEGINVEQELVSSKLKKQFKYADKKKFPFVLIIGEEEVKNGKYLLKDMKSGEQLNVDLENLFSKLGV